MDIKFLLMVEVLLAILEPGLARRKYKTSQDGGQEGEVWLEDFNKDYDFREMQADTPIGGDGQMLSYPTDRGTCPPQPRTRTTITCMAAKCKSDQECSSYSQKCCDNGCVYTCLTSISSPPYVDWAKNPRRPFSARNSWLLSDPDEEVKGKVQVEPCSTSAVLDDEDALLCPHGYMCHIEYLGEPEKGLPNRGRCLKENNKGVPHRKFRLKTEYRGQNVCVFEKAVFADGASFVFQDHPCECHDSIITCNVSKQKKKRKSSRRS